jgi:hypothetical protein
MPTGYSTRQSSTEIIDGQTANAADFNNEFNALLAAFASTGHSHNGSNGEGSVIDIASLSGVLGSSNGGITSTNADPLVTNGGAGFSKGSLWLNASNKTAFICASNGASTAIWLRIKAIATNGVPPRALTAGLYSPGDLWVDSASNVIYGLATNHATTSTWYRLHGQFHPTVAPSSNQDVINGFAPGTVWVKQDTGDIYVCKDNTASNAVWAAINSATINTLTAATPDVADQIAFYDNSAAANRKVAFWGIFEDGGDKSANFTATNGVFYNVTGSNLTITTPSSASARQCIAFALGSGPYTITAGGSLKINGVASAVVPGYQTLVLTYQNAAIGYV